MEIVIRKAGWKKRLNVMKKNIAFFKNVNEHWNRMLQNASYTFLTHKTVREMLIKINFKFLNVIAIIKTS